MTDVATQQPGATDPEGPDTDDAPLHADDTSGNTPSPASGGRSRRARPTLGRLLPWLLIGILGAALAVIVPQWNTLRQAEAERVEVTTVARDVVTSLTTWDASDGLDDTIEELRSIGTGAFADDVDPFFAGPQGEALMQAGASSTAVVRDIFVQTIDGDVATIFITLDQSISTQAPPGSNILPRRAIIDLQRVDGRWLANDVTVTDGILGPEAQQ